MNKYIDTYIFKKDVEEKENHTWELDKNGTIDEYALDFDGHNGPRCTRCSYSYCIRCLPKPDEKCIPYITDYTTLHNFTELLEKIKATSLKIHFNLPLYEVTVDKYVIGRETINGILKEIIELHKAGNVHS